MEKLFKEFKNIVLKNINENLKKYEDAGAKLPQFQKNAVVFGAIDFTKMTQNSVIAFYPEEIELEENNIDGEYQKAYSVTVAVVCKNAQYDELVKRMCRYAVCIEDVFTDNYTMNGIAQNIEIKSVKYFCDAGVVERQATAVEIEMTIYVETNYIEE